MRNIKTNRKAREQKLLTVTLVALLLRDSLLTSFFFAFSCAFFGFLFDFDLTDVVLSVFVCTQRGTKENK
jgi:hypothetical protein